MPKPDQGAARPDPSLTQVKDARALSALDKAVQEDPGGARNPWGRAGKPDADERIIVDNVHNDYHTDRPTGNAADAALRRLRKHRPDLHEQVLTGGLSPHAAMVEAGFRKRTISIPTDDTKHLAREMADAGAGTNFRKSES